LLSLHRLKGGINAKMRYDKLTLKAQEALVEAERVAGGEGHPQIEPEHHPAGPGRRSDSPGFEPAGCGSGHSVQ
jgi:hypothetical protein